MSRPRKTKLSPEPMPVVEVVSTPVPSRNSETCSLTWKTAGSCSACGMALNSPGSPLRAVHTNSSGVFCSLCCVECRDRVELEDGNELQ